MIMIIRDLISVIALWIANVLFSKGKPLPKSILLLNIYER